MTSVGAAFSAVTKLDASHEVDDFDCGREPLNHFLQRFALTNQKAGSASTYVTCRSARRVVGYYSLAVGAVEQADATARVVKGLARYPIPVMILARLAVDRREQARGVGRALLKDALLRTAQAAEIAGIRAALVHAKDETARVWYGQFNFELSPTNPDHLLLLMKDLRALIAR